MLEIKQPLFNLDGAAVGSEGWGDLARSVMGDEAPADEVQPNADTDAEGLESEQPAEGQDVVEPNPDDAETKAEEQPEAEKPAFDDESEVDLGEGRQPVKLVELKQGYLRQSDYTKKTQQLADERKTFDAERQEWEPTKSLNDFLTTNPWLAGQIQTFVKEFQQTGTVSIEEVLQDAQYGQYINTLMAQLQTARKEADSLRTKYDGLEQETTISGVISDLRGEYGELITPEYEQELREQAKTDRLKPEVVKKMAKGDLAEKKLQQNQQQQKTVTKEAEAKTIQALQEKRQTIPPQPRATGQRPVIDTGDITGMDWLDIAKMAGASMK